MSKTLHSRLHFYGMTLIIYALFTFSHQVFANRLISLSDTITWNLLQELEYKASQHESYGEVFLPKFAKKITKLANKQIVIKGYLVPVDKTTWALSKNTYASCFFCGKAGPETVMGLTFKTDPGKLKMDAHVYLKGTFIVNGKNVDDWMYSLKDAEIVGKL